MTKEEKSRLIDDFERASNAFDDVTSLPAELLAYRPNQDSWTIHEHVVHCLDVDIANFHRYRKAIAEPGSTVVSFDGVWTSRLGYQEHDLAMTLAIMKLLRAYMAGNLKRFVGEDWTTFFYLHSKEGRVNLEQALHKYVEHVSLHREMIDYTVTKWKTRIEPN